MERGAPFRPEPTAKSLAMAPPAASQPERILQRVSGRGDSDSSATIAAPVLSSQGGLQRGNCLGCNRISEFWLAFSRARERVTKSPHA